MNEVSLARIDALIIDGVVDLLQAHGVGVTTAGFCNDDIDDPFAASIGFSSEHLRGVLVLILERPLAVRSLPNFKQGTVPDNTIIADWTGELANQLLGRLKNGLHSYGLDISLGTPTVFAGRGLSHFAHKSPVYRCLAFKNEYRCLAAFQADYSPGFELEEKAKDDGSALAEGEVLFF